MRNDIGWILTKKCVVLNSPFIGIRVMFSCGGCIFTGCALRIRYRVFVHGGFNAGYFRHSVNYQVQTGNSQHLYPRSH